MRSLQIQINKKLLRKLSCVLLFKNKRKHARVFMLSKFQRNKILIAIPKVKHVWFGHFNDLIGIPSVFMLSKFNLTHYLYSLPLRRNTICGPNTTMVGKKKYGSSGMI